MYDVYVEEFKIIEWKDDYVYRTESLGHKWISELVRDRNIPAQSGIIFAAPSDEFSKNNMIIRRAK